MTDNIGSDHPPVRNVDLDRDGRNAVSRHIASVVGERAFKKRKAPTPTSGPDLREFEPEFRSKVVFPHVGMARAATTAARFNAFTRTVDEDDRRCWRLITLRLGPGKPKVGELFASMTAISNAVDTFVEHLAGSGKARPLLSAVQVRFDPVTARLDPHLQGIWSIADRHIKSVDEYLRGRFEGVWIDPVPVRLPRKAAYYICAGIFDYVAMPNWPAAMIIEVFDLPRFRFVRPAGDFAAFDGRVDASAKAGSVSSSPSPVDRSARPSKGLKPLSGVLDRAGAEKAAADQISALWMAAATAKNSFTHLPYTVHPAAPDSSGAALRDSPTLRELTFAVEFLGSRLGEGRDSEGRLRVRSVEAFEGVCRRLRLSPAEGLVAVAMTELFLGTRLFSSGWHPRPLHKVVRRLDPLVASLSALGSLDTAEWLLPPTRTP